MSLRSESSEALLSTFGVSVTRGATWSTSLPFGSPRLRFELLGKALTGVNATFDKFMVDVAADVAEMAKCMQMKNVARRMAACTFTITIFKNSASGRNT